METSVNDISTRVWKERDSGSFEGKGTPLIMFVGNIKEMDL